MWVYNEQVRLCKPSVSEKSVLYFDLRSGYATEAAGISRLGTGIGQSFLHIS